MKIIRRGFVCMDGLPEAIIEKEGVDVLKAAITHIEFEALHPFKDGNGRIGRMVIGIAGVYSFWKRWKNRR